MRWISLAFASVVFLSLGVRSGDVESNSADKEQQLQMLEQLQVEEGADGFVATHEWQKIPPGCKIPPGLHYKMDVSTGELFAKLVSEDDQQTDENTPVIVQLDPQGAREASLPLKLTELNEHQENQDDGSVKTIEVDAEHFVELPHTPNAERARIKHDEATAVANLLQGSLSLEELTEYAHDIDHGVTIVEQALPRLLQIVEDRNEGIDRREMACRVIGASLSNNPGALSAAGKQGSNVVTRLLKILETEPMQKDSLIINRLIYSLKVALGDNRGRLEYVAAAGGTILRKLFAHGQANTVYKLAELVENSMVRPIISEESWRRGELEAWAAEFEKRLIAVGSPRDADFADKAVLDALTAIKRDAIFDLKVSRSFLKWLATMAKKSHIHDPSMPDPDWQLAERAGEVRHLVFGNPKAQRKHNAEDL
jgi:hypothetical protein